MFIGQKKFASNAVLLGMIIGGQVVGGFLGLFWAWLTLMDKDLMKAREGDHPDHLVPSEWLFDVCPSVASDTIIPGYGCDTGSKDYGFSRDF